MLEPLRCNVYDTDLNLDLLFYEKKDLTLSREIETYQRLFQNFINKIFRSKRGHEISANLSNMLMHGDYRFNEISEPCKFITYKTVAKNGLFPNLAIHPSIIKDDILKFNKVLKIKLPRLDIKTLISINHLNFEILKTGLIKDEINKSLYWREPLKSDYEYI